MWKFRRVECPLCDHVYMWLRQPHECTAYKNDKKEMVGYRSVCPKCACTFAVIDGVFTGILESELSSDIHKTMECRL